MRNENEFIIQIYIFCEQNKNLNIVIFRCYMNPEILKLKTLPPWHLFEQIGNISSQTVHFLEQNALRDPEVDYLYT